MITEIKFNSPHIIQGIPLLIDVPKDIFDDIKVNVNRLSDFDEQYKCNNKLLGQLSTEIKYSPSSNLENFIVNLLDNNNKYFSKISRPCVIKDHVAWVNFQKKTEYNPVHNHSGDLSYVVWVKIPFDIKNEDELDNCKNSNFKYNGRFVFEYLKSNLSIGSYLIPVDKSYEQKMIIFPSDVMHSVYPFYTSDHYRISLAGNIHFLK